MEKSNCQTKKVLYDYSADIGEKASLTNVYFSWDISVKFVVSHDMTKTSTGRPALTDKSTFDKKTLGKNVLVFKKE